MNLTVNQQNLHLLLPGKMSRMAKMYIDDHKKRNMTEGDRWFLETDEIFIVGDGICFAVSKVVSIEGYGGRSLSHY